MTKKTMDEDSSTEEDSIKVSVAAVPVDRKSGPRITDYGSQSHAYHVIVTTPLGKTWSCFTHRYLWLRSLSLKFYEVEQKLVVIVFVMALHRI